MTSVGLPALTLAKEEKCVHVPIAVGPDPVEALKRMATHLPTSCSKHLPTQSRQKRMPGIDMNDVPELGGWKHVVTYSATCKHDLILTTLRTKHDMRPAFTTTYNLGHLPVI
jgi:hypothetical protein